MGEIEKMTLESESLIDDRLNKLKELMPEVFSESGIDFDKLRLELGDEVDEGLERYALRGPARPMPSASRRCPALLLCVPVSRKAAAAMERMGPSTRTTFISKATISRC